MLRKSNFIFYDPKERGIFPKNFKETVRKLENTTRGIEKNGDFRIFSKPLLNEEYKTLMNQLFILYDMTNNTKRAKGIFLRYTGFFPRVQILQGEENLYLDSFSFLWIYLRGFELFHSHANNTAKEYQNFLDLVSKYDFSPNLDVDNAKILDVFEERVPKFTDIMKISTRIRDGMLGPYAKRNSLKLLYAKSLYLMATVLSANKSSYRVINGSLRLFEKVHEICGELSEDTEFMKDTINFDIKKSTTNKNAFTNTVTELYFQNLYFHSRTLSLLTKSLRFSRDNVLSFLRDDISHRYPKELILDRYQEYILINLKDYPVSSLYENFDTTMTGDQRLDAFLDFLDLWMEEYRKMTIGLLLPIISSSSDVDERLVEFMNLEGTAIEKAHIHIFLYGALSMRLYRATQYRQNSPGFELSFPEKEQRHIVVRVFGKTDETVRKIEKLNFVEFLRVVELFNFSIFQSNVVDRMCPFGLAFSSKVWRIEWYFSKKPENVVDWEDKRFLREYVEDYDACHKMSLSVCSSEKCDRFELWMNMFSRCSRCKSTFYCSRKCQIDHWKQGHQKECSKK